MQRRCETTTPVDLCVSIQGDDADCRENILKSNSVAAVSRLAATFPTFYWKSRALYPQSPVNATFTSFTNSQRRQRPKNKVRCGFYSTRLRIEWLGMAAPQYFNYLSQSGTFDADGIDDMEEFEAVKVASG
jgi:hypothetical protein